MIPFIIYTHDSYFDVFELCLKLFNKFLSNHKIYIAINDNTLIENSEFKSLNNEVEVLCYNNNDNYTKRLISILEKIKEEYAIIVHEDMIPVNIIDINLLNKLENIMRNDEIYHIRSYMAFGNIISGVFICDFFETNDKIYKLYAATEDASYKYSIQPGIWEKKFYLEMLKNFQDSDYVHVEIGEIQIYISKFLNKIYYMHYENKNLEEINTFYSNLSINSIFYPHIHSCYNSKWVICNYPSLYKILTDNGINPLDRNFI